MAKKTETKTPEATSVAIEDYNKLLKQAKELETAYNGLKTKLVAISNILSI